MTPREAVIGLLREDLDYTKGLISAYLTAQDNWSLARLQASLNASLIRIRTLKKLEDAKLGEEIYGSRCSTLNHTIPLSDKASLWANQ